MLRLILIKGVRGFNNKALSVCSSSSLFLFKFDLFNTLIVLFVSTILGFVFFFSFILERGLCWSFIRRSVSFILFIIDLIRFIKVNSLSLFDSKLVFLLLASFCLWINTSYSLTLHSRSNKSILIRSYISSSSRWSSTSLTLKMNSWLWKIVEILICVNFCLVTIKQVLWLMLLAILAGLKSTYNSILNINGNFIWHVFHLVQTTLSLELSLNWTSFYWTFKSKFEMTLVSFSV